MTPADRKLYARLKSLDEEHPLWLAVRSEIASRNQRRRVTNSKGRTGRPRRIDRERVVAMYKDHTAQEIAEILNCHKQSVYNIMKGNRDE